MAQLAPLAGRLYQAARSPSSVGTSHSDPRDACVDPSRGIELDVSGPEQADANPDHDHGAEEFDRQGTGSV